MKTKLAKWTNQPGALNHQRNALAVQVERADMTFQEAKLAAGTLERDMLIAKVEDGDTEISDAEKEAERLACGPLAPLLDPSRFDPMQEPYWTLYMLLASIMWRSPDDVRRHWDKWRAEMRVWRPNGKGHSLHPLEPTSFFELRHDALISEKGRGNAPRVSPEDALSQLWRALQRSQLKAYGIDISNKRVPIEPHEFFDLHLGENGIRDGRYRDVIVQRADHQFFRVRSSRSLTSAEHKCREWLITEMNKWLVDQSKPIPNREDHLKIALSLFQGLSREAYGRARKAAVVYTGAIQWPRPGPKPRSSG